jgi:hypothetical protein
MKGQAWTGNRRSAPGWVSSPRQAFAGGPIPEGCNRPCVAGKGLGFCRADLARYRSAQARHVHHSFHQGPLSRLKPRLRMVLLG